MLKYYTILGDKYQTKPQLGAELVKELKEMGFKIKKVLADSLYPYMMKLFKVF